MINKLHLVQKSQFVSAESAEIPNAKKHKQAVILSPKPIKFVFFLLSLSINILAVKYPDNSAAPQRAPKV